MTSLEKNVWEDVYFTIVHTGTPLFKRKFCLFYLKAAAISGSKVQSMLI